MLDTQVRRYPVVFWDEKTGEPYLSLPPGKAIPLSRIFKLERVAEWARAVLTQPGGTQTNSLGLKKALEDLDG